MDLDRLVEACRENLRGGRDVTAGLTDEQVDALMTRYSRFEDARDESGMLVGSEVVIDALRPPRPFVHLMCTGHDRLRGAWGSFWDGTCGGFSCLDSCMAGRMTSHLDTNYVPTAPEVQDVRGFWVHEAGAAWPMFPIPGYEEDQYSDYQCRQGMDALTISARRAHLAATLTVHVPLDWPAEVWELTVTNEADRPRELSWFGRIKVNVDSFPFYYFVPRVTCEGLLEDGALVFVNHDQNNKHPRQAFLATVPAFDGYDMMSEVFDGWSPLAPIPAAVARGKCFNSTGLQPACGLVAAVQFRLKLPAGQSATTNLVYGAFKEDDSRRSAYIQKVRAELLSDPAASRAALAESWRKRVLANAIATPDEHLDRYFNIWSKVQQRSQSRFCHGLDKIGYRDIVQHMLALSDFDAPYVRARLAEALHYQFPDGRAVRQYEVLPGSGHDLRMYQDSPSWIPDTLIRYVKETGDVAFLDEQVPFLDPATNTISETESATVYEHAAAGLRSLYENTGYHGLCRIGYGDWNDALSRIGGEKGVSVWLSCACVYQSRLMAELAEFLGRDEDAAGFRRVAEELTERINAHAWDGKWYIYALNADGKPIGSAKAAEGRIHLNVNTWAVMSGVAAAAGREQQVWESVETLARPIGHLLLDPPYSHASAPEVGRIADILPGQFENGSMYTHGESFYLYALVLSGRSDKWLEEMPKTLPSRLVPDIATGPPHQQSNFAVGPAHPSYGMNLFSNFTGSLAWYRRTIEAVVGVLADFTGLRIDPRPPKAWDACRVVKRFRGCTVDARLRRGDAFSVRLDGKEVDALIPAAEFEGKTERKIEVTYT